MDQTNLDDPLPLAPSVNHSEMYDEIATARKIAHLVRMVLAQGVGVPGPHKPSGVSDPWTLVLSHFQLNRPKEHGTVVLILAGNHHLEARRDASQ